MIGLHSVAVRRILAPLRQTCWYYDKLVAPRCAMLECGYSCHLGLRFFISKGLFLH